MADRDIQGQWDAIQTNGSTAHFNIGAVRPDGEFRGTGNYSFQGEHYGAGFGLLREGQFTFTIGWSNGSEGAYIGSFDDQGYLRGATYDIQHPESTAGWRSSRPFS